MNRRGPSVPAGGDTEWGGRYVLYHVLVLTPNQLICRAVLIVRDAVKRYIRVVILFISYILWLMYETVSLFNRDYLISLLLNCLFQMTLQIFVKFDVGISVDFCYFVWNEIIHFVIMFFKFIITNDCNYVSSGLASFGSYAFIISKFVFLLCNVMLSVELNLLFFQMQPLSCWDTCPLCVLRLFYCCRLLNYLWLYQRLLTHKLFGSSKY